MLGQKRNAETRLGGIFSSSGPGWHPSHAGQARPKEEKTSQGKPGWPGSTSRRFDGAVISYFLATLHTPDSN